MPTWVLVILIILGVGLLAVAVCQIPPQNRFIDSAGNEDLSKLRSWLDKGVDVNKPGWLGLTALSAAVKEGRLENVKLILDHGGNPNQKSMRILPLQEAIDEDHLEIVKLLLEKGADPSLPGAFGVSPLEEAVMKGKIEVAEQFVKYGTDLNKLSPERDPILHTLLYTLLGTRGDEGRAPLRQMFQFLLNHGANPNARSKEDVPLLVVAMEDPPSLRILVDSGVITDISFNGIDAEPRVKEILENYEGESTERVP